MNRAATSLMMRLKIIQSALMLALLFGFNSLSAENHKEERVNNEFKLLVTSLNSNATLKLLKLNRLTAKMEVVYYFDTQDKQLQSQNLILRARQIEDQTGDSTVKIRVSAEALKWSDQELALPPEQDWITKVAPTIARSLSRKDLEICMFNNVASGSMQVSTLFTEPQRQLVETRMLDFDWANLKRFGPVQAEVWTRQAILPGFDQAITVELWRMQQDDRYQEILEVSAKVRTENNMQAKLLAIQFFSAAKSLGLGEPDDQSKTKLVMDFFKPTL